MKIQFAVKNPWMIATAVSAVTITVLIFMLLQLRAENQALKSPALHSNVPFDQWPSPLFNQPNTLSDPWELFQSLNDLQNTKQPHSLFDRWFSQSDPNSLLSHSQKGSSPTIDFDETDNAYIVTVNMPQGERVELNTNISGRVFTVSGKVISTSSDKNAKFHSSRQFSQTLTLQSPIDETKMTSEQDNQTITITLPKLTS